MGSKSKNKPGKFKQLKKVPISWANRAQLEKEAALQEAAEIERKIRAQLELVGEEAGGEFIVVTKKFQSNWRKLNQELLALLHSEGDYAYVARELTRLRNKAERYTKEFNAPQARSLLENFDERLAEVSTFRADHTKDFEKHRWHVEEALKEKDLFEALDATSKVITHRIEGDGGSLAPLWVPGERGAAPTGRLGSLSSAPGISLTLRDTNEFSRETQAESVKQLKDLLAKFQTVANDLNTKSSKSKKSAASVSTVRLTDEQRTTLTTAYESFIREHEATLKKIQDQIHSNTTKRAGLVPPSPLIPRLDDSTNQLTDLQTNLTNELAKVTDKWRETSASFALPAVSSFIDTCRPIITTLTAPLPSFPILQGDYSSEAIINLQTQYPAELAELQKSFEDLKTKYLTGTLTQEEFNTQLTSLKNDFTKKLEAYSAAIKTEKTAVEAIPVDPAAAPLPIEEALKALTDAAAFVNAEKEALTKALDNALKPTLPDRASFQVKSDAWLIRWNTEHPTNKKTIHDLTDTEIEAIQAMKQADITEALKIAFQASAADHRINRGAYHFGLEYKRVPLGPDDVAGSIFAFHPDFDSKRIPTGNYNFRITRYPLTPAELDRLGRDIALVCEAKGAKGEFTISYVPSNSKKFVDTMRKAAYRHGITAKITAPPYDDPMNKTTRKTDHEFEAWKKNYDLKKNAIPLYEKVVSEMSGEDLSDVWVNNNPRVKALLEKIDDVKSANKEELLTEIQTLASTRDPIISPEEKKQLKAMVELRLKAESLKKEIADNAQLTPEQKVSLTATVDLFVESRCNGIHRLRPVTGADADLAKKNREAFQKSAQDQYAALQGVRRDLEDTNAATINAITHTQLATNQAVQVGLREMRSELEPHTQEAFAFDRQQIPDNLSWKHPIELDSRAMLSQNVAEYRELRPHMARLENELRESGKVKLPTDDARLVELEKARSLTPEQSMQFDRFNRLAQKARGFPAYTDAEGNRVPAQPPQPLTQAELEAMRQIRNQLTGLTRQGFKLRNIDFIEFPDIDKAEVKAGEDLNDLEKAQLEDYNLNLQKLRSLENTLRGVKINIDSPDRVALPAAALDERTEALLTSYNDLNREQLANARARQAPTIRTSQLSLGNTLQEESVREKLLTNPSADSHLRYQQRVVENAVKLAQVAKKIREGHPFAPPTFNFFDLLVSLRGMPASTWENLPEAAQQIRFEDGSETTLKDFLNEALEYLKDKEVHTATQAVQALTAISDNPAFANLNKVLDDGKSLKTLAHELQDERLVKTLIEKITELLAANPAGARSVSTRDRLDVKKALKELTEPTPSVDIIFLQDLVAAFEKNSFGYPYDRSLLLHPDVKAHLYNELKKIDLEKNFSLKIKANDTPVEQAQKLKALIEKLDKDYQNALRRQPTLTDPQKENLQKIYRTHLKQAIEHSIVEGRLAGGRIPDLKAATIGLTYDLMELDNHEAPLAVAAAGALQPDPRVAEKLASLVGANIGILQFANLPEDSRKQGITALETAIQARVHEITMSPNTSEVLASSNAIKFLRDNFPAELVLRTLDHVDTEHRALAAAGGGAPAAAPLVGAPLFTQKTREALALAALNQHLDARLPAICNIHHYINDNTDRDTAMVTALKDYHEKITSDYAALTQTIRTKYVSHPIIEQKLLERLNQRFNLAIDQQLRNVQASLDREMPLPANFIRDVHLQFVAVLNTNNVTEARTTSPIVNLQAFTQLYRDTLGVRERAYNSLVETTIPQELREHNLQLSIPAGNDAAQALIIFNGFKNHLQAAYDASLQLGKEQLGQHSKKYKDFEKEATQAFITHLTQVLNDAHDELNRCFGMRGNIAAIIRQSLPLATNLHNVSTQLTEAQAAQERQEAQALQRANARRPRSGAVAQELQALGGADRNSAAGVAHPPGRPPSPPSSHRH